MITATTQTTKVYIHTRSAQIDSATNEEAGWIDLHEERTGESVTMFVALSTARTIREELDKIITALEAHEASKITGVATGERGGES